MWHLVCELFSDERILSVDVYKLCLRFHKHLVSGLISFLVDANSKFLVCCDVVKKFCKMCSVIGVWCFLAASDSVDRF